MNVLAETFYPNVYETNRLSFELSAHSGKNVSIDR